MGKKSNLYFYLMKSNFNLLLCFIFKVCRPDNKPEVLGLNVLDEPCAKQSDPTGKWMKFPNVLSLYYNM